jgi:Cu2+-exporting ATPase
VSHQEALSLAASLAKFSYHPLSKCLYSSATEVFEVLNCQEQVGHGVTGFICQQFNSGNRYSGYLKLGSAVFCGIPNQETKPGKSHVFLSDDKGWIATFSLSQTYRSDAKAAVLALQKKGIELCILSGDQTDVIQQVGLDLNIQNAKGACTPQDKLDYVIKQQALGRKVAVVGDGMNDAPVLAIADVSISLGSATPIAQSQADFLLLHAHLIDLVRLVSLSQRTIKIVNQNLAWAIAYNLLFIPLAVMAYMPAWLAGLGMALSSLLVIANATRLSVWSRQEKPTPTQ